MELVTSHDQLEDMLKAELLVAAQALADEVVRLREQVANPPVPERHSEDVFVQYLAAGPIPGGAVRLSLMHKNPPLSCLEIPHKRISRQLYEDTPTLHVTWCSEVGD